MPILLLLEICVSKEKNKLKPMNASAYSYWSALYHSFYSRRLYVDVGTRWRGLGILYLLLLIAICSIPIFIRLGIHFNDLFKEKITQPMSQIPVFYIQNGEMVFDKPMPYLIKNDKGEVVVAIDSTGTINDFRDYPSLTILINKNKMSFKLPNAQLLMMKDQQSNNSTPLVQPFDPKTNMVFEGKKIVEEDSITQLKYASEALIYPVVVSLFFSIFMIFFLVLGFLGQIFSSIFFSFKLSLLTSVRLLVVAGTPMLVLFFVLLLFHSIFPGLGLILFALLAAYYCFAIYSLRAESKQVVIV